MLDKTMWKGQVEVISPKLQEWNTRSEAVVILEENGVLEARPVSYSCRNNQEIEFPNIVSVLAVDTYREGIRISQLYNKMVNKGIKVSSLNSIVEALNILGETHD